VAAVNEEEEEEEEEGEGAYCTLSAAEADSVG
jgi:hypothetical protein